MEQFFKLRENGSSVSKECVAGLTTFFAMSYILFVNPSLLSQTGIPWGAVFLSTIFASAIGTLVMGLFANVPYALAPGMGLNAFFTYTVCFGLGYTWKQALGMVFLCGLINIFITVTRFRKVIIRSIPEQLQHAISAGIGAFIAYLGIKNAGLLQFTLDPGTYTDVGGGTIVGSSAAVPALINFTSPGPLLALIGLVITIVLLLKGNKAAILIGIIATTIIGIPMGVVDLSQMSSSLSVSEAFSQLGTTVGAAVSHEGLISLFEDPAKIPLVLMTIFAFSLSDTFDTIGTFIGTGRRTGIFSAEDERAMENSSGFHSKMDRALFADAIGTSMGALLGTSNTTTYVESAAGIEAGGRTGLTSVTTAILFLLSIFAAPLVGIVPAEATAPALILVGIMICASFADISWERLDVAIPAFFSSVFMALCYSISYGIAAGFITYIIVKVVRKEARELHPILIGASVLFILNFIILARL